MTAPTPGRAARSSPLLALLLLLTSPLVAHGGAGRAGVQAPGAEVPAVRAAGWGVLPWRFEVNQGQSDPRVRFLARGGGATLFLVPGEIVLALHGTGPGPEVVRLVLLGADPDARIVGRDELPGRSHYLVGRDRARWRTGVPGYARVEYEEVYPGVSLVVHGDRGALEYDFVVRPGGDPAAIRLAVRGGAAPAIDDAGDLVVAVPGGALVQRAPRVYQDVGGVRRPIAGGYALGPGGEIAFRVAAWDEARPLVIDPVLSYSRYLGGGGAEEAREIAVDADGNVYLTGFTTSTDFPTGAALQADPRGGEDVFVTKLDPTGTTLVYSTYLGGSGADRGLGLALDAERGVYVAGTTRSADFPTVNALQPAPGGIADDAHDAFVAKLDPTGSTLVYATYLGGSGDEDDVKVAVDGAGQAHVAGLTSSTDFPLAAAHQGTYGGGNADVFVAKLNAAGSALLYSTYLGGSDLERSPHIAVDGAGHAYVAGSSRSGNFPTTAGSFQPVHSLGFGVDAFVTKLAVDGSALVYSTYLGGSSGDDDAQGIVVDATGHAHVVGTTLASNFPTTPGAFQPSTDEPFLAIGRNAFVSKLGPTGAGLVYSTFLGGSGNDRGLGIAIDGAGHAYVTGRTASQDFPLVAPLQGARAGSGDVFVTRLDPAGSAALYSTFLGGSADDWGLAIAVDPAGHAYVTGLTKSANFPTTAAQRSLSGGSDAFVARIGQEPPGAPLLVASVLPSVRAIQVGGVATAFAAVQAVGGAATACRILPLLGLPADFHFQTTDPLTNALTGSLDEPVDIPDGGLQTFVVAFQPAAGFFPTDVPLQFVCANTAQAPVISGLDTLRLSAWDSPVPDIVTLATTVGNTGIVTIPGALGTGAFAVAVTNVGTAGTITVFAEDGATQPHVTTVVCQTDPATAQCINPAPPAGPAPIITVTLASGATATFSIFVTGTGSVAFGAGNRVAVWFTDAGGLALGGTSVAVQTQ